MRIGLSLVFCSVFVFGCSDSGDSSVGDAAVPDADMHQTTEDAAPADARVDASEPDVDAATPEADAATPDTAPPPTSWLLGVDEANTIFRINPADGTRQLVANGPAFDPVKVTYDWTSQTLFAANGTFQLGRLDPCTGLVTDATAMSIGNSTISHLEGLAIDGQSDVLYAAMSLDGADSISESLVTIAHDWMQDDFGLGALRATFSGTLHDGTDIDYLAMVDGKLISRDGDSQADERLYEINPDTGVATEIAPFDPITLHATGITQDIHSGAVVVTFPDRVVYDLEVATGKLTAIGAPAETRYRDLAFVDVDCQ